MPNHGKRRLPTGEAKAKALQALADGTSVKEAMALAERSEASYEPWRKSDPDLKEKVPDIRAKHRMCGNEDTRKDYASDFGSFADR
jgi:hypothetical protein